MPIKIWRTGDKFLGEASPPEADEEWSATEPMTVDELDRKLYSLGCHITDIGDAFYEADPSWVEKSER